MSTITSTSGSASKIIRAMADRVVSLPDNDAFVFSNGMTVTEEAISPSVAEDYLACMHPNQRLSKKSRVERYAQEMADGHWELTWEAIGFDVKGFLINGANRLKAIVKSGTTQRFPVYRNCPEKLLRVVDSGLARCVQDRMVIAGRHVSNDYASVARKMMFGKRLFVKHTMGDQALMDFMDQHHDAIAFASSKMHPRIPRVTIAAVYGVIGRAYYHIDHARLDEFCQVLRDSREIVPGRDAAAIMLRNYLTDHAPKNHRAEDSASAIYDRTQAMIREFAENRVPRRMMFTAVELFPLPETK